MMNLSTFLVGDALLEKKQNEGLITPMHRRVIENEVAPVLRELIGDDKLQMAAIAQSRQDNRSNITETQEDEGVSITLPTPGKDALGRPLPEEPLPPILARAGEKRKAQRQLDQFIEQEKPWKEMESDIPAMEKEEKIIKDQQENEVREEKKIKYWRVGVMGPEPVYEEGLTTDKMTKESGSKGEEQPGAEVENIKIETVDGVKDFKIYRPKQAESVKPLKYKDIESRVTEEELDELKDEYLESTVGVSDSSRSYGVQSSDYGKRDKFTQAGFIRWLNSNKSTDGYDKDFVSLVDKARGKSDSTADLLLEESKKYKTAEEFVKGQNVVYHGTGTKFEAFDDSMRGSLTGAKSAKGAIWFTDDMATAKAYSVYSAETASITKLLNEADAIEKKAQVLQSKGQNKKANKLFDKADDIRGEAEKLDTADATFERRKLANVKEVILNGDLYEVDAEGKSPQELSEGEDIDSWLDSKIKEAKELGKDGLKITNLDDAVGLYNRPSTHYAIFDSKNIKTKSQLIDIYNKAQEGKVSTQPRTIKVETPEGMKEYKVYDKKKEPRARTIKVETPKGIKEYKVYDKKKGEVENKIAEMRKQAQDITEQRKKVTNPEERKRLLNKAKALRGRADYFDNLSKVIREVGGDPDTDLPEIRKYLKKTAGPGKSMSANEKTLASLEFCTNCPLRQKGKQCPYCYVEAARRIKRGKSILDFIKYDGHIADMPQILVDILNKMGGYRVYSFGDYLEEHTEEVARALEDARKRGLMLKFITKQNSLIKKYGKHPNARFQISTDSMPNFMSEAVTPEKAAAFRKTLPPDVQKKVKIRYVARNEEEAEYGGKSKDVDVLTLYHGNNAKKMIEYMKKERPDMFKENTAKALKEMSKFTNLANKDGERLTEKYKDKTCCATGVCATCKVKCGYAKECK